MPEEITVKITSANVPGLLRESMAQGAILGHVHLIDDLTLTCTLERREFAILHDRITHRGDQIQIIGRRGLGYQCGRLLRRPVLVCGILLMIFLSAWLPTRILFVDVVGNSDISTRMILEEVAKCGIRFGISRRDIRSEHVKNNLLSCLPQLQWVGVNTRGCVAEIAIREKKQTETTRNENNIGNIVALRDGVITDCTVRKGTQLCSVGQAVKFGQTLVSGYIDCGNLICFTSADAEISADTERDLQVILPRELTLRGSITEQSRKYSLIIGKKLINFSKGSGISDAMCVKMYTKKYLTLPGGRTLPVALVIENRTFYECTIGQLEITEAESLLETVARNYIQEQMVAGQILYAQSELRATGDRYCLLARFMCNESIGKIVHEERFYTNGKNE